MVNDGKTLIKNNVSLSQIYSQYKDEDGFLYILYLKENVFAWQQLDESPKLMKIKCWKF